jgi:nicotinamide-nucleotide amidase
MKHIAAQIHIFLIKNRKTVAVAESCTGGLVSNFLTEARGSSRYFLLGIVAYSNEAKIKILKIPASLINKRGAVSYEIAASMAKSVKLLAKADYGIGITGIAGPGGGTRTKPVGTVFIGVHGKDKRIRKKFLFKGGRLAIRKRAALKALELLRSVIYK